MTSFTLSELSIATAPAGAIPQKSSPRKRPYNRKRAFPWPSLSFGGFLGKLASQLPLSTMASPSRNWPIEQLPGLSPDEQAKLKAQGIHSTLELLSQTQSPAQQQALSQAIALHGKHVGKWSALADLARVPGVGCTYCGLLLHSGISSTDQLARASVHRLHPQLMRFQVAFLRRGDLSPSASQVAQWIAQAKALGQAR